METNLRLMLHLYSETEKYIWGHCISIAPTEIAWKVIQELYQIFNHPSHSLVFTYEQFAIGGTYFYIENWLTIDFHFPGSSRAQPQVVALFYIFTFIASHCDNTKSMDLHKMETAIQNHLEMNKRIPVSPIPALHVSSTHLGLRNCLCIFTD